MNQKHHRSLLPCTLVKTRNGVKVDRGLECERLVASDLPACELSLFVSDDDRLGTSSGGGSLRQQHDLAMLLEKDAVGLIMDQK